MNKHDELKELVKFNGVSDFPRIQAYALVEIANELARIGDLLEISRDDTEEEGGYEPSV